MSSQLLLLLLPILISAQSTAVPSSDCRQELLKIMECGTYQPLDSLQNLDQIPFTSTLDNMLVNVRIKHLLTCTGEMYCPSSLKYQSYLRNQQWILEKWLGELDFCTTAVGITPLLQNCGLDFSAHPIPGSIECGQLIAEKIPCALQQLEKYAELCDRDLFTSVMLARLWSCNTEQELDDEFKAIGVSF